MNGKTYSEQRFSPLEEIGVSSVSRLGPAWLVELDDDERAQESTPLAINGVVYLTTSWSRVIAVDASSGRILWRFDPKVDRLWSANACCDVANRGAAFANGRLFVATIDGRLLALDARTGSLIWDVPAVDRAERATITGAPRVVGGSVFIGSAGGEFNVRGRLTAFDTETGEIRWKFFTTPGPPEKSQENFHLERSLETWSGEWWRRGGGAAVWDGMSYDPASDLLYIGTGNAAPWPRSTRSPKGGDNLFVSSIVALQASNGEYVWHYQTTPGDEWGYDAASQIVLAELVIQGQLKHVAIQASANGFLYVIERKTGTLISATPFVETSWAKSIDRATGRPIETAGARYSETKKPFLAKPGVRGAHSWHSVAFDARLGLLYIPVMHSASVLSVAPSPMKTRTWGTGTGVMLQPAPGSIDRSELIAWDPVAQKAVWRVASDTAELGGVLATAGGLVFQGSPSGQLRAFDSQSGKLVWEADLGSAITAAPITYRIDKQQFVAVVAGGGGAAQIAGGAATRSKVAMGPARLVAFRLGGNARLPPTPKTPHGGESATPNPLSVEATKGARLYAEHCARCHGQDVVSASRVPDLRGSTLVDDPKGWRLMVHAGQNMNRGMPPFLPDITEAETETIRAYVAEVRGKPTGSRLP